MIRSLAFFAAACLVVFCASGAWGDVDVHGYEALSDWMSLPNAKTGTEAGLSSSYDRAGGNQDYNHYESPTGYQSGSVDPTTVVTLDGPGVITRFWMPRLAADKRFTVKMTIDGVVQIDTDSAEILRGNYGYMQSPLVSSILGGGVSYEPIVFSQSLKIESKNFDMSIYSGEWKHYYQYSYHRLPVGTVMQPYTGTLTTEQSTARNAVVSMINNVAQNPAESSPTAQTQEIGTSTGIAPGSSLILANLSGSGVIRRLNVKMDGAGDTHLDKLRLRVRYDGNAQNAIDVPVSHFFGAGHDRAAYKSLPLGTDSSDGFYSYWPMPYRQGAIVELYNSDTASTISIDSAAVEYEEQTVAPGTGYFYAVHLEETTVAAQEHHVMLDIEGRGHYVGNLLYLKKTSINFTILEGDDIITVDGTEVQYGTGLEDAYNGGYYYNHVGGGHTDPEFGAGPYHGLLHIDSPFLGSPFARTDQYRWLIGDYIPFTDSIEVKVENFGRDAGVEFGSTAFYYLLPESFLPGDANVDGLVSADDYASVQTNFGATSGLGGETPVPEPGTLSLLTIGGLAMLRRKKRG